MKPKITPKPVEANKIDLEPELDIDRDTTSLYVKKITMPNFEI